MFLKKIGSFLLDVLCPPVCPICRTRIREAQGLCPACYQRLNFITKPCCEICGRPFEYQGLDHLICGACLKKKPQFDMVRSVLVYDDFSKKLILLFKHGDRTDLAPLLARLLTLADPAVFQDVDMIVPVPLHWTRRLKRKYNQAILLGRILGKMKKIPFRPSVLKRIRKTASQGHKHRKERELNVKGAFWVQNPAMVCGKRVLVIDDVMTTGATLNECAKVLKRAGAKEVKVITLYRVITI